MEIDLIGWKVLCLLVLGLIAAKRWSFGAIPEPVIDLHPPRPATDLDILIRMEVFTALATRAPRRAESCTVILEVIADPEDFVEFNDAVVTLHGRCPVCRHAVFGSMHSACMSCSTPHHADCWDYAGGCARYACGSLTAADCTAS